MRVLMTGDRGYIGTVARPLFERHGHDVRGLDSDLYRRCDFTDASAPVGTVARAGDLAVDIRDVTPDLLAGFDAVVHLAGLSNDPLGDLDPALTDEINHRATVALATAAKAAGVGRFVFSSSCSNYGASGDRFIDETAAFNPVTAYGRSKVDAERGLLALADETFTPTLLRSATAYGVSPRLRFDLVVNNLAAWAHTTGDVLLKSDGTPWRPIVHIRDIAKAFLAVVEAPRDLVHAEAFNVGRTDENYQIGEIAQIVKEAFPGTEIRMTADAGPDLRCYRVNCDRLTRVLPAAAPDWTLERGVAELKQAYESVGLTAGAFEGPRFQRVAHLRMLLADNLLSPDLRPAEFKNVA